MSKEIFKNITNSIEIYEKMSMKTLEFLNINIMIEILKKLLELVGDKEDKYYEEFFDIYIKEYKLKKNYDININYSYIKDDIIINVYIINNFNNIYEFIQVIDHYHDDNLFTEINNLLDNIIIPKPKKISIPIALKIQVWDKCIGLEIGKHKCLCCKTIDIIQMSFHCGHVIPECKGGKTNLSNLKPICQTCNLSMGTKNMDEFMKKFQ